MKNKYKRSEQLYTELVSLPFSQLVKQIAENDRYLDNVETKILSLNHDNASIELAFTRNGVRTAAQKVLLRQHDHLATEVSVYPIYSEDNQRSWLFPLAFMLIFGITISVLLRSIQSNILAFGMSLFVMSIFVYLGARYLEENSGKMLEYNQGDGELLLNMLRLSLSQKTVEKLKTSEIRQLKFDDIEPARPAAEKSHDLQLDDIETTNLDDETLLERKELHRKLDELS